MERKHFEKENLWQSAVAFQMIRSVLVETEGGSRLVISAALKRSRIVKIKMDIT